MRCPYCKEEDDCVIDSRLTEDGYTIRRRRKCQSCNRRYTTYERVAELPLRVIKKDGSREPFHRQKIYNGLLKACEKRPISTEVIDKTVTKIELELYNNYEREVPSKVIGELVIKELRRLDQVAYVRFASVYREFKDVHEFMSELKPMLRKPVSPTHRPRPRGI
jgi:transcriptional repressor NrdR